MLDKQSLRNLSTLQALTKDKPDCHKVLQKTINLYEHVIFLTRLTYCFELISRNWRCNTICRIKKLFKLKFGSFIMKLGLNNNNWITETGQ